MSTSRPLEKPAHCIFHQMSSKSPRCDASDIDVAKRGAHLSPRLRAKNWGPYFDSRTRGSLPQRRQPPLDERTEFGRVADLREENRMRGSSK